MRLTLLKGSIYPDPEADREVHDFTYVVYPHVGNWRSADIIQAASNLNSQLYGTRSDHVNLPEIHAFVECDAPNITLEAGKRSEDGRYLVLRLVERFNRSSSVNLTFDRMIKRVWLCDLMENAEKEFSIQSKSMELEVKPYELITLKLEFEREP